MKALLMREYKSLEVADMPVPGYLRDLVNKNRM